VSDRPWLSAAASTAWSLAVLALFFGGFVGWTALGGMCEDFGSSGSEAFCNRGGWEATGLVFACMLVLGIVVPAMGLALRRKRLFWSGVVGPVALAALNFALATVYGQG
jgi:hypothetical protein